MIGIYKIISPNGKIYIGQSINIEKRWIYYKNLYKGVSQQIKLYNSLKKYGPENHIFEVIEECNMELLNDKEIYWVKYFNSVEGGLNIRLGGEGGGKHSIETKLKISNIHKGLKKPRSQKFREQISQKLRGRKILWVDKIITKERNKKISLKNKGKINGYLGKNPNRLEKQRKKIDQYSLDGEFIMSHLSINEASKYLFGDSSGTSKISNNLNGVSKKCAGYVFKYQITIDPKI